MHLNSGIVFKRENAVRLRPLESFFCRLSFQIYLPLSLFPEDSPKPKPGKLASLEDFISMQNEELAAQRQEIESAFVGNCMQTMG